MSNKEETLFYLEKYLEQYDKVFLLWNSIEEEKKIELLNKSNADDKRKELLQLIFALCNLEISVFESQRVLLLIPSLIFHTISNIEEKNVMWKNEKKKHHIVEKHFVHCCEIADDKAKSLFDFYHIYEFSDRFQIISREERYGSLFQLVDTGLLTLDEMAKALLH